MPDGLVEPVHGHNWELKVTVTRPELDKTGFVVDFHDLEKQVDAILAPLHNRNLSDVPPMADLNATAENVCWHVARCLKLPPGVALESVQVTEAPGCVATYRP